MNIAQSTNSPAHKPNNILILTLILRIISLALFGMFENPPVILTKNRRLIYSKQVGFFLIGGVLFMNKRVLVILVAIQVSGLCAKELSFYDNLCTHLTRSGATKHESVETKAAPQKTGGAGFEVGASYTFGSSTPVKADIADPMSMRLTFAQLLSKTRFDLTTSAIIGQRELDDLDIIPHNGRLTLVERCAPCTVFGDVLLTKMLALPLESTEAIAHRQQVIKTLVADPAARETLEKAVQKIKSGQNSLLHFCDAQQPDYAISPLMYPDWTITDWANNVAPILFVRRCLRNKDFVGGLIPCDLTTSIQESFNAYGALGKAEGKFAKLMRVVGLFTYVPYRVMYKGFFGFLHANKQLVTGQHPALSGKTMTLEEQKSAIESLLFLFITDISYPLGLLNTIQAFKNEKALFANLQKQLMGVARVVEGLADMHEVLKKYPALLTLIPELDAIAQLFDKRQPSEFKQLIAHLQTNTFKGEPSYWSNGVRILQTYHLLKRNKDRFVPALEAIGIVDAFHSVARMMSQPTGAPWCFVTISGAHEPTIKLDGCWNPLMDASKAVVNDVHIGVAGDQNMLITGPNGSGKSTVMRAVVVNMLLAQSFGVAAATSATITPFGKINVYLNEQEDLQKGLSTFMAEALKLREICQFIVHVPAGSRSLTLIDEGLRGTVSVEAGKRLSAALTQAAANKQSVCIVATHLPEPVQLETQTNGAIRNYCVVINEVSPGTFVRTFKLARGASQWWFDDAEKRKRFVDWLIQLADASVAGAIVKKCLSGDNGGKAVAVGAGAAN